MDSAMGTRALIALLFSCLVGGALADRNHHKHSSSAQDEPEEQCYCAAKGTCSSSSSHAEESGDIDIRIVTPGEGSGCGDDEEQCCGCGIRDDKGCKHPWLAALLTSSGRYLGGGVLLAPDVVMTAAHKVKKRTASNLIVRLGAWDLEANSVTDVSVESIWIHPDFDKKTLKNDVAILKLSESVSLSANINMICLPKAKQSFQGKKCWVAGWGKDAFGPSGSYQTVAKEVDVKIISKSSCEHSLRTTRLGKHFSLDSSFICAGGETDKDACTGDGGSPLVCEHDGQWFVVGLVAWGIGCGQHGVPGVYVNIPHFVSWVEDKME